MSTLNNVTSHSVRALSRVDESRAIAQWVCALTGAIVKRLQYPHLTMRAILSAPKRLKSGRIKSTRRGGPRAMNDARKYWDDIRGIVSLTLAELDLYPVYGEPMPTLTKPFWDRVFSSVSSQLRLKRWDYRLSSLDEIEALNKAIHGEFCISLAMDEWQWSGYCGWHWVQSADYDSARESVHARKVIARRVNYLMACARESAKIDPSRKAKFNFKQALRMIRATAHVMKGGGFLETGLEYNNADTALKAYHTFLEYIRRGEASLTDKALRGE